MLTLARLRKKRAVTTLQSKARLINEVQLLGGKRGQKSKLATSYGMSSAGLSNILRNKERILVAARSFDGRCSTKLPKYPHLDERLINWCHSMRSLGAPLSGSLILSVLDFKASPGFLTKFKRRHKLTIKTIAGEARSADHQAAAVWRVDVLDDLLLQYAPDDVFNADETALFYKLLPTRTFSKCAGFKKSKERVTVLFTTNMSGSEKLRPLVICYYSLDSL